MPNPPCEYVTLANALSSKDVQRKYLPRRPRGAGPSPAIPRMQSLPVPLMG